jgi:hypothetical protein
VLRLTLDTSCVIHGAQAQFHRAQIDELVELARDGRVGLWLTTAFANDQDRAPADKHQRNRCELEQRAAFLVEGPHCAADDDRPAGVEARTAPGHPEVGRRPGGDPRRTSPSRHGTLGSWWN